MNDLEGILALLAMALQNYNPNGETRVGPQQTMASPNGAGVNVELGRGNFPGTPSQVPVDSPTHEAGGMPSYDRILSQHGAPRQDELLRALIPGLMRGGM